MASTPVAVIRQNLAALAPEFEAALPAHITVAKFSRVAMTAIQNNPALQNADRQSLFGSIVRLAQDGLLPDGREAAIVMFGNKAQAMPMIAGVLKKIRQSGEVKYISAQVVYENDEFVWTLGFEESVTHNPPALDKPRGKAIGAYATAVLSDGSRLLEVMSLEEIEKVRAVSRASKNGPWVAWWSEMARKTVMRRLSKRLPMSTDIDDAFERDVIEQGVTSQPQPMTKLEALEAQISEGGIADEWAGAPSESETTDPETGEVLEDKSDDDAGEVTTLDSAKAEIDGAEILADVNSRVSILAPLLNEDDANELRSYAMERIEALKGGK